MPSCEKGGHFSGVSLKNWSFERSTMDAKRIVWVTFIRLSLAFSLSLSSSASPRGSSSRDCRIVEGVRPFRRQFSSVKLFRCRRMPSRGYTLGLCTYAWEIRAQIRLKVKGRMCSMDHTYWSSSTETLQVNSYTYEICIFSFFRSVLIGMLQATSLLYPIFKYKYP